MSMTMDDEMPLLLGAHVHGIDIANLKRRGGSRLELLARCRAACCMQMRTFADLPAGLGQGNSLMHCTDIQPVYCECPALAKVTWTLYDIASKHRPHAWSADV